MNKRPLIIGLTGSIGMGKSTTAEMFAELGVPVWDADQAVHRLYGIGGAAVKPIQNLYPDAIIAGVVSREALKTWIAADPGALKQIEQIVHPMVACDRAEFIKSTNADLIVLDIPLLFETGSDKNMDVVVVVSAPAKIQQERVLARDGMTIEHFEAIKAKQLPDKEKRNLADYVIETSSIEQAKIQVAKVLQQIRKKTDA
jgi:dephospho-CoA kinase